MELAGDIDPFGMGQLVTAVGVEAILVCNHNQQRELVPASNASTGVVRDQETFEGQNDIPSPALPGSGSTGLRRSHAELSAFVRKGPAGSPDQPTSTVPAVKGQAG